MTVCEFLHVWRKKHVASDGFCHGQIYFKLNIHAISAAVGVRVQPCCGRDNLKYLIIIIAYSVVAHIAPDLLSLFVVQCTGRDIRFPAPSFVHVIQKNGSASLGAGSVAIHGSELFVGRYAGALVEVL